MWKQTHSYSFTISAGTFHDQCRKKIYRGSTDLTQSRVRLAGLSTYHQSPGYREIATSKSLLFQGWVATTIYFITLSLVVALCQDDPAALRLHKDKQFQRTVVTHARKPSSNLIDQVIVLRLLARHRGKLPVEDTRCNVIKATEMVHGN